VDQPNGLDQPTDAAPPFQAPPGYPHAGYAPPPGYLPAGYGVPSYPVPGGYTPAPGYGAYPPAYPPGYPQGYGPASTSSSAIVALILAVTSWLVCPIVPAIVALVFAARADREVRGSGGTIQGGGLSMAAKIISWINIGLFAAILLMAVVFFVVAVAIGALDAASGAA